MPDTRVPAMDDRTMVRRESTGPRNISQTIVEKSRITARDFYLPAMMYDPDYAYNSSAQFGCSRLSAWLRRRSQKLDDVRYSTREYEIIVSRRQCQEIFFSRVSSRLGSRKDGKKSTEAHHQVEISRMNVGTRRPHLLVFRITARNFVEEIFIPSCQFFASLCRQNSHVWQITRARAAL